MLDGRELEGGREGGGGSRSKEGRKDGAGGLPVLALLPVEEGEGDACVRDVEVEHVCLCVRCCWAGLAIKTRQPLLRQLHTQKQASLIEPSTTQIRFRRVPRQGGGAACSGGCCDDAHKANLATLKACWLLDCCCARCVADLTLS